MITYHAKLVAKQLDCLGYTTFVFKNLDKSEYIMCVMFPNWEQSYINLDDEGYVTVKYVEAGIDKWYDGKDFVPYKYTNIIFLKFIKKEDNIDLKDITLD